MTREEFIDDYMRRSGIDPKYRIDDGFLSGFRVPGSPRQYAARCECGNKYCKGFAMISESKIHPEKLPRLKGKI